MNYSNPMIKQTDGNNWKSFTYENGEHPYHLYIEQKGWIPLSLMLFANSAGHALSILKELIKWSETPKSFESAGDSSSRSYLKAWKKAMVTLKKGETIDIYEGVQIYDY